MAFLEVNRLIVMHVLHRVSICIKYNNGKLEIYSLLPAISCQRQSQSTISFVQKQEQMKPYFIYLR